MTEKIIFVILFFSLISCTEKRVDPEPDCTFGSIKCAKSLTKYGDVEFSVTPQPVKTMKTLRFHLTFARGLNHGGRELIVDLSMPGMNMGINQVNMEKTGPKTYMGLGVLPICPNGKKLWKATVMLGESQITDFTFNVL